MALLPVLAAGVLAALSSVPAPPPPPVTAQRWVAPLDGPLVVLRRFDPPADPWGAGHRGVDLGAAPGATVRVAGAGRVTFAAVLAGRGVVVVSHGALRTTYEPVDAAVAVGATVGAGQPLGRLALSGSHCAPRGCLHWGLLRGSDYLDPLLLLRRGHVRLLPLAPARIGGDDRRPAPAEVLPRSPARPARPADRAPPLLTTAGAVTTGAAGAAALWWRRREPP
jgi:murein DD-endopeptidase MepM/ murein hydrolase activator NlpD